MKLRSLDNWLFKLAIAQIVPGLVEFNLSTRLDRWYVHGTGMVLVSVTSWLFHRIFQRISIHFVNDLDLESLNRITWLFIFPLNFIWILGAVFTFSLFYLVAYIVSCNWIWAFDQVDLLVVTLVSIIYGLLDGLLLLHDWLI